MSTPPIRLRDDPSIDAELQSALDTLAAEEVPFDLDAGIEKIRSSLDGGPGGGAPDAATATGAGVKPWLLSAGAAGVGGAALLAWSILGGAPATPAEVAAPPTATQAASAPAPVREVVEPAVPEPATPSASSAAPPAKSKPAPVRSAAPTRRAILADEVKHLRNARRLAASNPAAAARSADEGHRKFPRGVLYQEREALAITSLARAGQHGPARARAERFLASFPKSPLAEQVRRAANIKE